MYGTYPVTENRENACIILILKSRSLALYETDKFNGCPKTYAISSP